MQQLIKLFLTTSLLTLSLQANSCWNLSDNKQENFSELESSIIFSFKDAKDCTPLADTQVKLFGQTFTTDTKGEVALPPPPSEVVFEDMLKASKDGYMTLSQKVRAEVGTFSTTRFLLSKEIPLTSARVVLSWGEYPKDLDLHIKSSEFHISYRNKAVADRFATLDRDSTQGFGPETITLAKLDKKKTYEIFVHQYSDEYAPNKFGVPNEKDPLKNGNLTIYANGKLAKNIQINGEKTKGKCIKVASIKNNTIEEVNVVADEKECR